MITERPERDNLRFAQEYYRMGWSIVPLAPGKKMPPRSFSLSKYLAGRASETDLERWFSGRPWGIGVGLGEVSDNLCVRDFDKMSAYTRWAQNHPRLAAQLPTAATGRRGGGRHVYFTADLSELREWTSTGDRLILKFDDGELKGGGIAVLPPSRHRTGRRYRWIVPPDDVPYVSDLQAAGLIPPELTPSFHKRSPASSGAAFLLSTGAATASPLAAPRFHNPEEAVKWAVETSLPTEVGQRHTKVFDFVRRLQSIPGLQGTDPQSLRELVEIWHRKASPNIRTKNFEQTWRDFLDGWKLADQPFGLTMALAVQAAQGTGIDYIESLCRELQRLHGDKPFFLSHRVAGILTSVSHTTGRKWIERLLSQGKLRLANQGSYSGRRASEYWYVGPMNSQGTAGRESAETSQIRSLEAMQSPQAAQS